MDDDSRIERFQVPTLEALEELTDDPAVAEKVRAVLAREVDPCDVSPECKTWVDKCHHEPAWFEQAIRACDELLEGFGDESLNINEDMHTDEGVRCCPPFSYVNMGDSYITTLARDHDAGAWVIADCATLIEEYEREHKCGDYEEFNEEPERCPSCHATAFTLTVRPDRSYWVCTSCNHHCYAVEGYTPSTDDGDNDDDER